MRSKTFEIPREKKILVVGSIFDQTHKLNSIHHQDYSLILINGNICFPFDFGEIEKRIEIISNLPSNFHYNLGAFDLVFFSKLKKENRGKNVASWILNQTNFSFCSWPSSSNLVVGGGGMIETSSKIELEASMESIFLSSRNGKPWQEFYRGRLGYGIGNHPLSDDPPDFFNCAARIGSKYRGEKTKIWAQEVGEYGLLRTFEL